MQGQNSVIDYIEKYQKLYQQIRDDSCYFGCRHDDNPAQLITTACLKS